MICSLTRGGKVSSIRTIPTAGKIPNPSFSMKCSSDPIRCQNVGARGTGVFSPGIGAQLLIWQPDEWASFQRGAWTWAGEV